MPIGQLATGGIGGGRGTTVSMPSIDVDGKHRLVITNFATPPPPSGPQARAYQTTFYPGAVAMADATSIDISYGSSRTGIDIQLRPVPAVRVSGRLTTDSGEAPPQLLLRLMPAGEERLGFVQRPRRQRSIPTARLCSSMSRRASTLMAQAAVMDFTTGSTSRRLCSGLPTGGIGVGSVAAARAWLSGEAVQPRPSGQDVRIRRQRRRRECCRSTATNVHRSRAPVLPDGDASGRHVSA